MVKKTPLDVDTTTVYEGEAAKIDPLTGAFDTKPVYAIRHTTADSEKSSDDTVIMVETACAVFDTGGAQECVNGNDPDLITASIDRFATDRVTALAVEDKNLPADAGSPRRVDQQVPFDVEKKTYPFWDGDIGRAVDIDYQGTETLFGLETYEFSYTVKDEPIEVAEGIPGTYDNVVTVWVDPKTGSIVKSGQDQQRFLEDGTPALDVQLTQTDNTVESSRRGQVRRQVAHHPAHDPPDRRDRGRHPVPDRWAGAIMRGRNEGGRRAADPEKERST